MQTLEEELKSLGSYIQKLKKTVAMECSFTFGRNKIVSKARIDDVICCIQASYPKDYRDYVRRNGMKSLETYIYFQKLLSVATKKFVLSSNHYSIDYIELNGIADVFMSTARSEIRKIENDNNFQL